MTKNLTNKKINSKILSSYESNYKNIREIMGGSKMNAPGKGLLKVTGILLIIFAGINIFAVIGLGALAASLGVSGTIVIMAVLVSCILAALQLIAGILGVKNCGKPEKAQVNFILGILLIVGIIINQVVVMLMNNFTWWSAIVAFVLPVLYIVGAIKNKEVAGQVADKVDGDQAQ